MWQTKIEALKERIAAGQKAIGKAGDERTLIRYKNALLELEKDLREAYDKREQAYAEAVEDLNERRAEYMEIMGLI